MKEDRGDEEDRGHDAGRVDRRRRGESEAGFGEAERARRPQDDLVSLFFGRRDARSEEILRGHAEGDAMSRDEEAHLLRLLSSLRGEGIVPGDPLRDRIREAVAEEQRRRLTATATVLSSRPRGSSVRARGGWNWFNRPVPAYLLLLVGLGGALLAHGISRPHGSSLSTAAAPAGPGSSKVPAFIAAESYETAAVPADWKGEARPWRQQDAIAGDSL